MRKLLLFGGICFLIGCKAQSSRETIDLTKMGRSLDAYHPTNEVKILKDSIRIINGKIVPAGKE